MRSVTDSAPTALPTRRTDPLEPPEELALLRETAPICRLAYPDGHVGWLVTSHELARAVLGDSRFTMEDHDRSPVPDTARRSAFARLREQGDRLTRTSDAGNLLRMDPPRHTRLRRALAAEFTVRGMEDLRPRIAAIVAEQLDLMASSEQPVDFVETFALSVPSIAICELLGVPYERHHAFDRFSTAIEDPTSTTEDVLDAYREFGELIFHVIDVEKRDPSAGLIGRLVAAGELSDDEIAGVGRLLVAAGHHTVKNQLGLSLFALLSRRDRWEVLLGDRALVPGAVEELLRYLTIFKTGAFTRTASVDCEVGGVAVRRGESVTVSLSAANRDPDRFPRPDELEFHRERTTGHLAFGYGIHMCLGQHLARVELQLALEGLLDRFPTLHLAVPADEVVLHPDDLGQAGPEKLPVAW